MSKADEIMNEILESCKRKARQEVRDELKQLKIQLKVAKQENLRLSKEKDKYLNLYVELDEKIDWVNQFFIDTIRDGKWAAKEFEKFKKSFGRK